MKSLYKYLLNACCYQVLETFPTSSTVHRHWFLSSSYSRGKKKALFVSMFHIFVACSILGWLFFNSFHYKIHILFLIHKTFIGHQLFVTSCWGSNVNATCLPSSRTSSSFHTNYASLVKEKVPINQDKKYRSTNRCEGSQGKTLIT